jgi:hypothetical protein
MTRMRNIALGGLAALAIGGMASSALAEEPGSFQNRLSGATIGLPLGALPPPGLYTGLETAYLGLPQSVPSTGNFLVGTGTIRANLPAIANAVPLLFVPGWSFLGASYGMSVVQAFYANHGCTLPSSCGDLGFFSGGPNQFNGGGFVTANTTFNPITLSWNLGGGWFVSGSFNFMAPDGTRSNFATGQTTPNPDYWTLEPAFAVSYLSGTWNISGNFFYDINTASKGNCCDVSAIPAFAALFSPTNLNGLTGGNLFYGDLHALYKMGKWSFGPVGAFEFQTTADSGTPCTFFAAAGIPGVCNRFGYAQVGALVGYDFGPVDLQVWLVDGIWSQNAPAGAGTMEIYTRLGFKLWGPDAPKPLVAKN